MAEGPHDELLSINSATTSHFKTRARAYCVALFADGRTDGRTDTQQRHVPRLA